MKAISLLFIFLSIYSVERLLRISPYDLPDWVVFYLADFLVMPIVLAIALIIVRWLKKDRSIRLSLFTVFSVAAFYSVYFEWYLPEVNPRYTADIIDVFLYFGGSLLFYFLQKKV